MVEAHVGQNDGRDQIDHHDGPADELVGRQRLHKDGQHRHQSEADGLGHDEPEQVLAELVVGVALDRLHDYPGQRGGQQGRDQHQDQGQGLGQQEGPVGRRRGIDDLMRAPLAVAPDQFARIIDGDDQDDQAERTAQGLDHHARHQQDRRAVDLASEQQGRDAEGEAQGQHDEIGRALEHRLHLEAGARNQLRQPGLEAVGRRRQGRDGSAGVRRGLGHRLQLLLFAQFRPARRRAIEGIGGGQEGQADAQPQQLVTQQQACQRRIDRIALCRRPVFGRQAIGAGAEGLQPGHQRLQLRLGAEHRGRGHVEDEDTDDADIGRHHRARDGRQGEEDR
ncbi:hypothetical protein D3C85_1044000 [compost metagenome]